ncbi:cob(I)yrinic acid a,c-diamide adenosyltransferase [Haloimpatiens sp. FM7315]|uniref:cob(I)yrinic acid a,c-diamide adenosyltransferase n=1 Tax=Haloimpatiens sp. FM7315 TaxID=3298609 RepID=UPI0035A35725
MDKGYVHVYTGNGKGKTTAAFGLAIRAAMAGKKVYIGQFIKGMKYNETKIQNFVKNITIEQLGRDCFINKKPDEEDLRLAKDGLEKCGRILKSGEWNLVILDELTIALYFKLISIDRVVEVIKNRNPSVEVVITGRYAKEELLDIADLVTDMEEVKHYYTKGVLSRDGIDH